MVLLTFPKGLQEDSFTAPPLTLADFKVFFSLETFTLKFELSGWVGLLGKGWWPRYEIEFSFIFFFFWDGGHTKPVWTNLDRPLSFCLSLLSHWDYSLTEKDLPGHLPSLVQWHQLSFQRSQQFIHRQLWHSQVTRNPWVFLHEQEISVTFDFAFTPFAVTISPVCNNTAFWYLDIRVFCS